MVKRIGVVIILSFLLLLPTISTAQNSVQSTISLVDGSLHEGNYIQNPSFLIDKPTYLYYDSQTGYIYIINNNTDTISVFNPKNDTFINYIRLTSTPLRITQGNGTLFISLSNEILEVNSTNFKVISYIPLASKPCSVLYVNGYLYVVEYSSSFFGPSNTILVINPKNSQTVIEIQTYSSVKELLYIDGKIYALSRPSALGDVCVTYITIIDPITDEVINITPINITSYTVYLSLEYSNGQLVLIDVGEWNTYLYFLTLNGNIIANFTTYNLDTSECPYQVIYNDSYIYASYPDEVLVVNAQTDQPVANIPINSYYLTMLYLNGYLYVAGKTELYIINTSNMKIAKVIQTMTEPNNIVYYKYIFVQNPAGDSITVINPTNNEIVKTFLLNGTPVLERGGGNYLYVITSNSQGSNLTVIDLNNLKIAYSIPVITKWPYIQCPVNSMLYLNGTLYIAFGLNPGEVYAINLTTDTLTNITVGEDPDFMIYADGKIFVANNCSNSIYVINPKTNEVIKEIGLPSEVMAKYINSMIYANGYIFVGGFDYISVINASTMNVIANYSWNGDIYSMAYANNYLFVYTVSSNATIGIINLATGKVQYLVLNYSVETPLPVKMLYANGYVFVTDPYNNSVLAINTYDPNNVLSIPVGDFPIAMVYANGHLYVLNEKSQTISIINVENATATPTATTLSTTEAIIGGLFFLFIILAVIGLTYKLIRSRRKKKVKQPMPQPIVPSSPSQPSQPQLIIPPPPPPPLIYQLGQGIIKRDGTVSFTLSSLVNATIISAKIEGTALTSVNINPNTIRPGSNEITIKFNDVSSLMTGMPYKIILTINVEGNIIKEINVYAFYS